MILRGFIILLTLLTNLCCPACGLVRYSAAVGRQTAVGWPWKETRRHRKRDCSWFDSLMETFPCNQTCRVDGVRNYKSIKHMRRVALVVRGESYRSGGGHHDRIDCVTAESLRWQRKASLSHVRHFIEPIEACGVPVDVFIGSYEPIGSMVDVNSTQDLIDSYTAQRVVGSRFVKSMLKDTWDQSRMFLESVQMVSQHSTEGNVPYAGVFVIRHDVILKQDVMSLKSVDWNKMLFAWKGNQTQSAGRVTDILEWIPWPYLGCVVAAGFREHQTGIAWREMAGNDSVGFMLPGEHAASSELEFNDLYRLVRPEADPAVLATCRRHYLRRKSGTKFH